MYRYFGRKYRYVSIFIDIFYFFSQIFLNLAKWRKILISLSGGVKIADLAALTTTVKGVSESARAGRHFFLFFTFFSLPASTIKVGSRQYRHWWWWGPIIPCGES